MEYGSMISVLRDPECIFTITFFNFFFLFLILGLPWIANYQCCRSQPAGYNPELVQERMEAVQWSPTYCGSLQVFGWVVVFFLLFGVCLFMSLQNYFFYISILLHLLKWVLSFVKSFEATLNREKMILFFLILFSWVTANQASACSPELSHCHLSFSPI